MNRIFYALTTAATVANEEEVIKRKSEQVENLSAKIDLLVEEKCTLYDTPGNVITNDDIKILRNRKDDIDFLREEKDNLLSEIDELRNRNNIFNRRRDHDKLNIGYALYIGFLIGAICMSCFSSWKQKGIL
jgi:hypothetical protein